MAIFYQFKVWLHTKRRCFNNETESQFTQARLRFHWVFQSSACLAMLVGSRRRVCLTHRHFRSLMASGIGICCVLLQSSLLEIVLWCASMSPHIVVEDGPPGLEEDVPVVPDWLQGDKDMSSLSNPGYDVLPSVSCLADNAS